ncbi:MAG: NAD(P)/FAD-dependent oxidoreductase [Oscillospiraceae bacterium]
MRDVVIIGGGVIGCAVARELSRFDLSIIVLEKTADICNGQSKANSGIVHGGYDAKEGTLKAEFNVLGNAMFDRVCSELEVPFKRNTSMVVAFEGDDESYIDVLYARGIANGVPNLKIITRDEILKREPNINAKAKRALLVNSGGIVCPYELTQAYAENAAKNGVEFLRNAEVKAIEKTDGGYIVKTAAQNFETRAVVNCAGLYSDKINNMVSEDKFTIYPRRGEYYIIDKNYEGKFNATVFQTPTEKGKGILIAPTVDGTILLGPTADDINDKDDTRCTSDGLERVLAGVSKTWNNIPNRAFITTFSGVRAHCDRNDFVLGEAIDAPMFFNAGGIESPGLSSAPAIGKWLSEQVAIKLNAEINVKFNPVRTEIPKFRSMTNEQRSEAIKLNPDFAKVVCRCETVTEAEIRESIRRPVGARTVDGVKRRTRAGMGRCQSGFCTSRVMEILCEELGLSPLEITKCGGESKLLTGYLFEQKGENK